MSNPQKFYTLYRDGFRSMVLGRTLWKIIIIKLLIIFGVLKLFFFPDFLTENFDNDQEKADYVLEAITAQGKSDFWNVKQMDKVKRREK
ncbi:MAG: DUF4492 domain-containing protein [Proteobacteria bacterium]|nr:DUF4492 domain-containing protein [Pseudomonadota bacterium]MBU1716242.1 DUF4492 domain-containing protein [Pseudomonadota bacterium]